MVLRFLTRGASNIPFLGHPKTDLKKKENKKRLLRKGKSAQPDEQYHGLPKGIQEVLPGIVLQKQNGILRRFWVKEPPSSGKYFSQNVLPVPWHASNVHLSYCDE